MGAFDSVLRELGPSVWYLLHALALAGACALIPGPVWVRLAMFGVVALSYGAMRDLVLGNVSVMLLLPLVVAWRWLDRPLGSIAQALAMAVRPALGVLLVWQLLRRRWRAVAWTVGAGLVLIALSLPFVGIGGYFDYLTVLGNLGGLTGVGGTTTSTSDPGPWAWARMSRWPSWPSTRAMRSASRLSA